MCSFNYHVCILAGTLIGLSALIYYIDILDEEEKANRKNKWK